MVKAVCAEETEIPTVYSATHWTVEDEPLPLSGRHVGEIPGEGDIDIKEFIIRALEN